MITGSPSFYSAPSHLFDIFREVSASLIEEFYRIFLLVPHSFPLLCSYQHGFLLKNFNFLPSFLSSENGNLPPPLQFLRVFSQSLSSSCL